jgi:hypothetical protein
MPSVSETIVREYFELHGFLVREPRKYVAVNLREEEAIDFFALNPQPRPASGPLPFVLNSEAMRRVERAVVRVIAWHTETLYAGVLTKEPEIFRIVESAILRQAARFFGGGAITKLLVVPALPHSVPARDKSIELLRGKGVDAVLPFRTLLADLVACVEPNRNYQKSDLLQIIRLLKNYDFFKEPQMELFKPRRRRTAAPVPAAPAPQTDAPSAA